MRSVLGLAAVAAFTLAFGAVAEASCVGSGSFAVCTDAQGNSYTVNRFGSTTMVQGSNAQTGSSWSQTTQNFGNMSMTNGQTNGRSWTETQTSIGGGYNSVYGTDSRGQSYNYLCGPYGCTGTQPQEQQQRRPR